MSVPIGSPQGSSAPRLGRAVAVYTALRFVVFLGSSGALLASGAPLPLAVFGGLAVSSVSAWFGLRRQREAIAVGLEARSMRRRAEKDRLRSMLDGS